MGVMGVCMWNTTEVTLSRVFFFEMPFIIAHRNLRDSESDRSVGEWHLCLFNEAFLDNR